MSTAELHELIAAGQFEAAGAIADFLLTQAPADSGLWHARAFIALNLGQPEAALSSLQRAAELAPQSALILTALGSVLATLARYKEAESVLHRAYRLDTRERGTLHKLASVLRDLGKIDEAVMLARRLVNQEPTDASGWRLLGEIALRKADPSAALRAFERALELKPDQAIVQFELAQAALACNELERARRALDRALALDPKYHAARAERLRLKRALCEWADLDADRSVLLELAQLELPGADPEILLKECSDPQLLLQAARAKARSLTRSLSELPRPSPRAAPRRGAAVPLRIGLLGARFGEDAIGRALVEVLERLKSQVLELTVFATVLGDDGPIRKRIQAVWPVVELEHWPAPRAAQRIADAGLHVLIDVSSGERLRDAAVRSDPQLLATTILALRPCNRQLRWFGLPSSSGAPWIDGLIADNIALPSAEHRHYSETIVTLPVCMVPLDGRRAPPPSAERARFGLPAQGFLFACFADPGCLNAEVCTAWARILQAAPGALLWLSGGLAPDSVQTRLQAEFGARGIAPERILIAAPTTHTEHLARLTVVDLFLDPWPQGARHAVVDAIIAACPVLTWPGRHLASRHAASLNAHLGLTDLNCGSLKQYLETAIAIANNPVAAEVLRETVRQARLNSPLFDLRKASIALFESLCLFAEQS